MDERPGEQSCQTISPARARRRDGDPWYACQASEGPTMLTLPAHLMISAGIMAAFIVLTMIGNALEAGEIVRESPGIQLTAKIVFLGLTVALMFSLVPVMVKLVLGFQAGIGNAGHPVVAGLIARERVIVFV